MVQSTNYEQLMAVARDAFQHSYAPYSKFRVGAALLAKDGQIFSGCNIEVVSYAGTMCAERVALAKAVSTGVTAFEAIAVVCEQGPDLWPCGICRQLLAEFGTEIQVLVSLADGSIKKHSVSELLPNLFPTSALK